MSAGSLITQFEAKLDRSVAATFNKRRADKDMQWAVEKRFALEAIARNDYLQKCSVNSLTAALLNVAVMGLTLDPSRGHAYLIPRKIKASDAYPVCMATPSYKGLEYLAKLTPEVANIQTELVCENDPVFEQGMDRAGPYIEHKVARKDRGEVTHAYTVTFYANGTRNVEVMSREELDQCKAAAKAANKGNLPASWAYWESELQKKCCTRRASKHWPISSARISKAIEAMDKAEPMDIEKPSGVLMNKKQVNEIRALAEELGMSPDQTVQNICATYGVAGMSEILSSEVAVIKRGLRNRAKAGGAK